MREFLIYYEGDFYKFGSRKKVEIAKHPCVIFISRELVFVDKVTLPAVAFKEGGEEALEYQARRIFGIENLKVSYKILKEEADEIELLLFAVKDEIIEEILSKVRKKEINLVGISLLSVYLSSEVNSGAVWIDWGNGYEIGVCSGGQLEETFFFYKTEEEELSLLERLYPKKIMIHPFEEKRDLPERGELLFKYRIKPKSKRKSALMYALTLMLIITVCLGGYYAVTIKQKISLVKQRELKLLEQVKSLDNKIERLKEEKKKLETYQEVLTGVRPVHVLEKISKILPEGSEIWVLSIYKKWIEVEGFSPSVSDLLERFNKVSYIKELKLMFSRPGTGYFGKKGEIFRLRFKMKGEM